jgi:predicted DNA-binding transcriptional regulator AlpA
VWNKPNEEEIPMAGTDLLTIAEAAEVVRVPVATLRYWRYLGAGPRSFRVGRRVVYRRGEIEAWLAEMESAAAGAIR